jgi:mannonate dehydratase
MRFSRRRALQTLGVASLAPLAAIDLEAAQVPPAPPEGTDTPKIAVLMSDTGLTGGRGRGAAGAAAGAPPETPPAPGTPGSAGLNIQDPASGPRRIKQLGINHVCGGGPGILPWTAEGLRAAMKRWSDAGITVGNMMINVPATIVYGRPGRDADIDRIKASLEAAGRAGLAVVEYNFYAHRATEGYYEDIDTARGDSGWTSFDYDGVMKAGQRFPVAPAEVGMTFRDLPPRASEGAHTAAEIWANIAYYLKAVVPVAERANVRMALHPNDPPAPLSRGSEQTMGSLAGWKQLIGTVNSPANCITYDCGVTRELGEDPVIVARWFASRDRIGHVHFRNVKVTRPREKYTEVWIDEGDNNMFAVMRELVKNKYKYQIYPEHPRRIDYDTDRTAFNTQYPGGGGYAAIAYNVGYARAMLQAVLSSL